MVSGLQLTKAVIIVLKNGFHTYKAQWRVSLLILFLNECLKFKFCDYLVVYPFAF